MTKKAKKAPAAPRADLYQAVTDKIVELLEQGAKPWARPWNATGCGGSQLRANGAEYRGINQLLLCLTAGACGYRSPYWLTFKQALDLGGNVRKGEKSTEIVFYKKLTVEDRDAPEGEEATKQIPMLRSYRVFNAEQCDGLPERYQAPPPVAIVADGKARDERSEAALRSCGADIREGGGKAFYRRGDDFVQMPPFDAFELASGYVATLAHELIHWTGAPHRLDRTKGRRFADADYAFEELVAEIGAAFTLARLGTGGEHIDNHAAYVGSWLKALRDDKRAIFKAAALAQSACDMVLAQSGLGEAVEEEGADERIAA